MVGSPPEMTFAFTQADAVAAADLHFRRQFLRPATVLRLAIVALVIAVVIIAGDRPPAVVVALLVAAAMLWAVAVAAALYFAQGWRMRRLGVRQFREMPALRRPITVRLTDDGYMLDQQDGHSRVPWHEVLRWAEDDRVMLLYRSRMLYHMLPKRVLGTDSATFARERLIAAGIPQV